VKVGGAFIAYRYKSDEVPGIPDDWFILDNNVHRYGNYILSLKLKHITPRMVIAPHFKTRGRVRNSIPPKKMWKQIGPTLKIIDKLCDEIGAPIKEIVSVYRSPGYNKAVRGNRGSYHMTNQAIDVMFNRTSPWRVAHVARQLRADKVFKGGIGRYSHFVHIDTRGVNADW
tara:strand:+ start:1074 stop:1586 length:513 start_codon:yes stop_codon:yes gene_type:complete